MRIAASNETRGLLAILQGSSLFHHTVRVLRLQPLAEMILGVLPLMRRTDAAGLTYRLRSLESFLLADEIFSGKVYRDAFDGADIATFVDLGCNVGYFVLYAAEHSPLGRQVIGLAVDGNRAMVDETRHHVALNCLANVQVEFGVVGFASTVDEATFYVNPSNVASSAQPILNPRIPKKGDSRPTIVPVVHVFERWQQLHGDRRIDLLKIDIEGSERAVLENEQSLLRITDRVVIEWHKWITSLDEIGGLLRAAGFVRRIVVGEDENCGVAVFSRA